MMRNLLILLAVPAMIACSGDKGDDTETVDTNDTQTDTEDPTTDDVPACVAEINSVDPADGATNVDVSSDITVFFDAEVDPAHEWYLGVQGVEGEATLAADGLSATFVPASGLSLETTYSVEASTCGDLATTSQFSTEFPAVESSFIDDKTYGIRFGDLVITEPANPAPLLALVPIDWILVQSFWDGSSTSIDAFAATAQGDDAQDIDCSASLSVQADFSLNPIFQLGPNVLTIPNGDLTFEIEDFELTGQFAPDGNSIVGVNVRGLIATENALAGETCEGGSIIQLVGPSCEPCTSSTTGMCLVLEGSATVANWMPGSEVKDTCGL